MNVAEFLSLTKLKKKKEKKKEKKSQLSYVSKTITKFWETEVFFFFSVFSLSCDTKRNLILWSFRKMVTANFSGFNSAAELMNKWALSSQKSF